MKTILSFAFILISLNVFSQYEAKLAFDWASSSTTANAFYYENDHAADVYGNVYALGTTINTSGNTDIFLVKYNSSGVVQWQQTFNGAANAADQGGKLYLDAALNIYVTGYATDNVTKEEDVVFIKYNNAGTQQWVQYFNGAGSKKDGGTAICEDNVGNLYVAGTAYASTTKNDFVLLKYSTAGVLQWSKTYDFNNNNELATGVSSTGVQVFVTGGSESSSTQWQYTTVTYSTTGVQVSVNRAPVQSNSFGSVRDVYKDGDGNTYIAGTTLSGGTNNIYLAKLDNSLNVLWTQSYGGPQNEIATAIATDASGNVYVAGETTTTSQGRNMLLLKYNSSGTIQWFKQLTGDGNGDDGFKDMEIKDDIIFLAGYATNLSMDYITAIYNTSGELLAYQYYDGTAGMEDKATNLAFDDEGLLINGTSQNAMGFTPTTVRYDYVNIERDIVSDASNPLHNNGEVIIKFERSRLINYSKIDDEKITFGPVSDFVHSNTIDAMKLKLNTDANMGAWKLVKIFLNEKTSDTIDINPVGDTIIRPHFYSIFRLMVPAPFDEQAVADSLDSLATHTVYCHLNTATELIVSANDTRYVNDEQKGLFSTNPSLANAHIHVEDAWDVETGHPAVRVAVFDAGVRFTHEDFTQAGVSTGVANSVFYDGFNYHNNKHLKDDPDNGVNNHGSNVAGIIGAVRNNSKGVAGIAGGDASNASAGKKHGVSMYSMKIVADNGIDIASTYLSAIADANRVFSATIYNHSWVDNTGPKDFNAFEEVIWQTYRKGVLHVCGVGNDGDATINFPASFDDDWVISVGSNNSDGFKSTFSNTSPTLDFIAPGEGGLYMAPRATGNSDYGVFSGGGTSFATPHITGIAALMQSHTVRNNREILLPDDIQTILKRNATDVVDVPNGFLVGRDDKSGFGRIDAGKILKLLEHPKNYVRHFKAGASLTSTKINTDINIDLREDFNGLAKGMYQGDRYEVVGVSNHNLPGSITIKDSWVTPCVNSGGLSMSTILVDIVRANHAEITGSVTNATCSLKTFVYKITKDAGGTPLAQPVWVPAEPNLNNVKLNFSLLLEDNSSNVSVHEQNDLNNSVEIYPVPASGNILNFSTDIAADEIKGAEIFSVDGKLLLNQVSFAQAQNNEYTLDVSSLSAGVYFIRFSFSDERSTTKKFIIIR